MRACFAVTSMVLVVSRASMPRSACKALKRANVLFPVYPACHAEIQGATHMAESSLQTAEVEVYKKTAKWKFHPETGLYFHLKTQAPLPKSRL